MTDTETLIERRRVSVRFAWYDLWVGAYWDRKARVLYLCPLPCVLVTVQPKEISE